MGMFDKLKGKAAELAGEHGDKADQGLDKAAEVADEKTGGKYTDQINSGAEKAKDAMDNLGQNQNPTPNRDENA
jgi:hypothetical protein